MELAAGIVLGIGIGFVFGWNAHYRYAARRLFVMLQDHDFLLATLKALSK